MYKSRKRICRIVRQKGQPLGLAICSTTCFLDLSLELRNQVYKYVLIAPRPIIASSVAVRGYESSRNDTGQTVISHGYVVEKKDPILKEIATNVLFCHPIIADEAARCFYQSNTFCFEGGEVWNPLYFFLQSIGDYNRSFLRNLSIEVNMPVHSCQDRYGTRILRHYDLPFDIVHSLAQNPPLRVKHPRRQIDQEYIQSLKVLDPAIPACFHLLGSDGPPILLNLDLKNRGIPGTRLFSSGYLINTQFPDFPDYLESLRQEFAQRVAILWHGYTPKILFEEEKASIQQKWWDIVETREEDIPLPPWYIRKPQDPPHLMTYFTIRRTGVETV